MAKAFLAAFHIEFVTFVFLFVLEFWKIKSSCRRGGPSSYLLRSS